MSYGKSFDPESCEAGPFVTSAKTLRVLNNLRGFETGLPLTSDQFEALTPPVVVDRLLARHQHRLALYLCDYLGLRGDRGRDKVLVHWACAKVRASGGESDEAVRDSIRRKLAGVTSVSYADIAATADSAGRRRLATMLLDFELRVGDQVPILLKMREGRLALEKACDSGDTELIYMCLMHLRRALRIGDEAGPDGGYGDSDGDGSDDSDSDGGSIDSIDREGGPKVRGRRRKGGKVDMNDAAAKYTDRGISATNGGSDREFLKVVLAYPVAVSLLAAYAASSDRDLLVKLYVAAGRYVEAGQAVLRDAYAQCDEIAQRAKMMKRAIELFREGEKATAGSSSSSSGGGQGAPGGGGGISGGGSSGPGAGGGARAAASIALVGPAALNSDRSRGLASFLRQATEEQLDLLRAQAALENEKVRGRVIVSRHSALSRAFFHLLYLNPTLTLVVAISFPQDAPGSFLDQPACDTLFTLVAAGDTKKAQAIVKDFKLSDANAYYVRIRALAGQRDWAALTALSNERKPPVGYRPFAEACQAEGATIEAKKFALRLPDYDEKADMLLSLGAFTEAAEIAGKAKDVPRLQHIMETAPTPAAKDIAEKALVQLGVLEPSPGAAGGGGGKRR